MNRWIFRLIVGCRKAWSAAAQRTVNTTTAFQLPIVIGVLLEVPRGFQRLTFDRITPIVIEQWWWF